MGGQDFKEQNFRIKFLCIGYFKFDPIINLWLYEAVTKLELYVICGASVLDIFGLMCSFVHNKLFLGLIQKVAGKNKN